MLKNVWKYIFFWPIGFLLTEQLKTDRKRVERERERGGEDTGGDAANGPRPGIEPRAAAARTEPLYMGRPLYPPS